MARKILVIALGLSILMLTAGFLTAQYRTNPNHWPPDKKAPAAGAPYVITPHLGYHAARLLDGLDWPFGIGVSARGDNVYFTEDDPYLYWHRDDKVTPIGTPAAYLGPCRNHPGGIYVGDYYGNIWKIDNKETVKYLGSDEYEDPVYSLDVDPLTGAVYFVTNYFENGYSWTGLYKLPPNSDTAILLDSWEYYPSFGLALRANQIYISDVEDGEIWKMRQDRK